MTKKLINSEIEFQNIFENSIDEIFLVETISMKIINVNQSVCDSTGYTKDELIGKRITKIVPPSEFVRHSSKIIKILKGEVVTFQGHHKKKDDSLYPIEIKIKVIKHKGKKVFMGISRDLTEQNRADDNIASFSKIFNESLNEIYLFKTGSLKFVQMNDAALKNIGYSAKELEKLTPVDIKPEFTLESFKKKLRPLLNGEKEKLLMETVHQRKDGSCYNVEVHLQITQQNDESLFTAFILDITARRKEETRKEIVNTISNKLNDNLSLDEFCQYVFSELQNLKPFPNVYISKYDSSKNELGLLFNAENMEVQKELPEPRKYGNGLSEHILTTKKGLILNGDQLSKFQKEKGLTIYGKTATSWIGVPLMSEDKVLGVLAAQCFLREKTYTESDLELLSFIGTQIGSFIEKKFAEKEIKQFENFFDVAMDLLCIAGTDGYFKKINPKFSEVLGYTNEEFLSKSFIDFVHEDDKQATLAEVEKLSKGIPTIKFTNRYKCKNGEYKYLLWGSALDPDTQQIFAAAKDITGQMKSQEILKGIAEIQDAFIVNSQSNEAFENMLSVLLKVTQSEYGFIGETLLDENGSPYLKTHAITNIAWDKETRDFYEKNASSGLEFRNLKTLFGQVMTTGEPVISNSPYSDPRKGGLPPNHPRMDSFMGLPFYKDKKLIGIVGIANQPRGYTPDDIELLAPFLSTCSTLIDARQNTIKRQEAEKQVSKLADIVGHSSDAIISTDQNGTIISWNKGAVNLLGYTQDEVIGTSVNILGPELLKKEHLKIIKEVRNGKSIESYETVQMTKKGIEIHVNMSIFPLIDDDKKIKGISSILRDISEQREARRIKEEFTKDLEKMVLERTIDLEKTQHELALSLEKEKELGELKSRFVSTASHQFRTPLAVIQANMGVLDLQKDRIDEKYLPNFEKSYDRIRLQIKNMTNLMDEVLVLGKINSGSIQPNFEQVHLVELCKNIISIFEEIQDDNRKMNFTVTGDVTTILLDFNLMEHAISNIISNAFKYSKGTLEPSIIIHFGDNDVEIRVIDKGLGIPKEDLEHLFEPFYRATNTTGISGTGLGSAIAKEYIELNRGTIKVKSKLNEGSEFIVTLSKK